MASFKEKPGTLFYFHATKAGIIPYRIIKSLLNEWKTDGLDNINPEFFKWAFRSKTKEMDCSSDFGF